MIAFAARYGHADPAAVRRWPMSDLVAFNAAVGELIEEEAEAMRRAGQE